MSQDISAVSGPAFATLKASDEYSRYFQLLLRMGDMLKQIYHLDGSEKSYEAQVVQDFANRLINTVHALRMKYMYSPAHKRMLWIDLEHSGFPNTQEISTMSVDLLHLEERLRELPPMAMLKQLTLDYMFKYKEEPKDFLWQLAERSYLEMLQETPVFLPFMLDKEHIQKQKSKNKHARTYQASWACYDFKRNQAFIHIMTFEQNNEVDPLELHKANHLKLLEVIQAEGSRVPDVGILAMAIDDALETIHPKIIKRIGLGPLYTPLLLEQEDIQIDKKQQVLLELLNDYGKKDDFILAIHDDIIFSKKQQLSRSIFAPAGRVREVFHIPETDPESYARRASVIHKHVLMPHSVAQHVSPSLIALVPELQDARILTYDAQGAVHGNA